MSKDKQKIESKMSQLGMEPRQVLCWSYYIDPKSDSFGVVCRSAEKAGYTKASAERISLEPWFKNKIRRLNLLPKAERNLEKFLDMDIKNNPNVVLDASKFVASRLGKESWSEKSEVQHSGEIKQILTEEQINELINRRKTNIASGEIQSD